MTRLAPPAFVVFVTLTLQTTLIAQLDFFGAQADIMMLLPIAAGINGGRDRGAIVGFIAGLSLDLVVHGTPTGFFALGYTLVGYLVGMAQAGVLRAAWWIPVVTALGASAVGIVILAVLGKFLGLEGLFDRHLVTCLRGGRHHQRAARAPDDSGRALGDAGDDAQRAPGALMKARP